MASAAGGKMLDDLVTAQKTGPGGQPGNDSVSSATGSQPNTGSSDKSPPTLNPSSQPRLEQKGAMCGRHREWQQETRRSARGMIEGGGRARMEDRDDRDKHGHPAAQRLG